MLKRSGGRRFECIVASAGCKIGAASGVTKIEGWTDNPVIYDQFYRIKKRSYKPDDVDHDYNQSIYPSYSTCIIYW